MQTMARDLDLARPQAWSEPGRTTLEIRTGAWRAHRPRYVEAAAPCRQACPAGAPIAQCIEAVRDGRWASAWSLIRRENPMPAVTGRVCAHPCETACNRDAWDGSVAINALEQFVGDWGLRHGTVKPPAFLRAERVAVVGGGPAGLACAYHLARLGYATTLFEATDALGGVLRRGIPEYRLPRAVLDRELELVLGLGTRFLLVTCPCVPGWGIDDDASLAVLRAAVESRILPLYEIEDGVRYRVTHWPEGRPVDEYITAQRRYAHLGPGPVAEIQAEVDRRWEALLDRAASKGEQA